MKEQDESRADISRRQFIKVSGVIGIGALSGAGLVGCGGSGGAATTSGSDSAKVEFDVNDWDSVLAAAKGKTVNFHQAGTDAVMNEWLNTIVKDAVAKYDVGWNYTPATNTVDIVNLVSSEMTAGKTENGSVDFMWVNGENFYSMKENGYWFGPFLESLPNIKYCDPNDVNLTIDCGVEIEGLEAPYQATYGSFWANTDIIPTSDLPENPDEFMEMAKKYPGQFIYPEPGNWDGTYFAGTMIAGVCGKDVWDRINREAFKKEELKLLIEPALQYLRDLNPYLRNQGTSFPSNGSIAIQLFADKEIACCYSSTMPKSMIEAGTVPTSTKPFFLKTGVLHDFWYMAIPKNATNPAAAMVAINAIMDPAIQISQFQKVGYYPFTPYELMEDEQKAEYDKIDWSVGLLNPVDMLPYTIPQANGQNNDLIEEIWAEEVLNK